MFADTLLPRTGHYEYFQSQHLKAYDVTSGVVCLACPVRVSELGTDVSLANAHAFVVAAVFSRTADAHMGLQWFLPAGIRLRVGVIYPIPSGGVRQLPVANVVS